MILNKYTAFNELFDYEPISEKEWRPIRRKEFNWASLYGVDLSGCNIRNRRKNNLNRSQCEVEEELSDINQWNSGYWAAVLISPRHAVACAHYWRTVSSQQNDLVFWGKSGTEYRPTFKAAHDIGSDRVIIEFEESLPRDDVKIYKIADIRYIPEGSILWQHDNQGRIWFRRHITARAYGHEPATGYFHKVETDPVAGGSCIFSGDSGTPCLVCDPINNDTYLVGLSWGGSHYWDYQEVLNTMMEMDEEIQIVYPMNNRADTNRDGVIDGADLATVLESWGQYGYVAGDVNFDGKVDGQDLGYLLGQWGDVESNVEYLIPPEPNDDSNDKPKPQKGDIRGGLE